MRGGDLSRDGRLRGRRQPRLHVRIPNLAGFPKDEVIIPTHSRNVYDAAIRAVGVKVLEVDTPEALTLIGPGGDDLPLRRPLPDSGPMSTEALRDRDRACP
jgi:L-seryl-tRNA(Ser) seleniumtransferase